MYGQIPYMVPYNTLPVKTPNGIGSLIKKINLSSILSNTQKTLNVVNQAIPLYYQVKPMFKNIKMLSKITSELVKSSNKNNIVNKSNINNKVNEIKEEKEFYPNPTFFL